MEKSAVLNSYSVNRKFYYHIIVAHVVFVAVNERICCSDEDLSSFPGLHLVCWSGNEVIKNGCVIVERTKARAYCCLRRCYL